MKKKLNKKKMREFIARMIDEHVRTTNENFSATQSEMELLKASVACVFR